MTPTADWIFCMAGPRNSLCGDLRIDFEEIDACDLIDVDDACVRSGPKDCTMARIRFDFGKLALDAELFDTPTAKAILAALPMAASALTWGEEVYFEVPVEVPRETGARSVVTPGEIAYWPKGHAIAIGFGRTPISRGEETRLASPCNVFAKAAADVKTLATVRAGTKVKVTKAD